MRANDRMTNSASTLADFAMAFEEIATGIRAGVEAQGLTYSEIRLLNGIGAGETGARVLSRRLHLDEGHVSRMVKRLGTAGLITTRRNSKDARRVELELTVAGFDRLKAARTGAERAAATALDDPAAADILAMIGQPAAPAAKGPVKLTPVVPGDLGWVIEQHMRCYSDSLGIGPEYEAYLAGQIAQACSQPDPARETGWILRSGEIRLGSAFCVQSMEQGVPVDATAEIAFLLVLPEARRQGLGRALAESCRNFAARAGYQELLLHSYGELRAGAALCRSMGFARIESRPVTIFGRLLDQQLWALPLE